LSSTFSASISSSQAPPDLNAIKQTIYGYGVALIVIGVFTGVSVVGFFCGIILFTAKVF